MSNATCPGYVSCTQVVKYGLIPVSSTGTVRLSADQAPTLDEIVILS